MQSKSSIDKEKVLQEIRILTCVNNPNVITLIHSWLDDKHVVFITELMTSGTLKSFLQKTKGPVRSKILKNWARQILCGLSYLHSKSPPIIHRDLKCENIFINGNNGQAKIGDLGLAVVKNSQHLSSVLGTPEFLAPEVYDEKYDEKVDIYAFGMVLLEIITKEYPYAECSNQAQIYKKVSSGIKPLALSRVIDEASRAFVELCLNFDPENRPSALELLSHPFLSDAPMMSPETSFDHIAAFSDVSSVTSYETTLRNEAPSNSLKHIVDAEHHTFLILERPTLSKAINNSGIPDSHCVVEYVDRPSEHEVTLKMLYGAHGAPISEIRFPFKLLEDTAEGVVAEMIKEALIAKQDEVLAKMKLLESLKAVFYGPKRGMNNEGVLGGSPLNSPLLKPSATPYHLDLSGKTRAASLSGSVNLLENSLNLPGSATGSPEYPTPWNTLPRASKESTKDEHFPTPASCQSSTSMDEAVKNRLKELQELNLQGLGSMDANKTSTINRHRAQPILGSGDSHQWPITFGQNSQSRSQSFVRQSYSTRLPSEPTIGQLAAHQRSQSSNSSISGITNISTENLNFDQLDHIEKS